MPDICRQLVGKLLRRGKQCIEIQGWTDAFLGQCNVLRKQRGCDATASDRT